MSDVETSLSACDTFPKLLLRNAKIRGDAPAYREKDFGIWQVWTWSQVAEEIRAFACGLAALGVHRGDHVALIGQNRPELYWSFTAIEALGAIPVPLYADSVADEMAYVLHHADVVAAICEDQEQIDKVLSVRERVTSLNLFVYRDPRGLRSYAIDGLYALSELQEKGRTYDQAHPEFYLQEVAQTKGKDLAIIAYTSGTTGNPKGVMLSHNNLIKSAEFATKNENIGENEDMLAYLPLAWVGDHFFSAACHYAAGFTISCPENRETVMHDTKEIGPTVYLAPPAIFENYLTSIQIRMEDAGSFKRKLYHYFMAVAKRCGIDRLEGRAVSFSDRLLYSLGEMLVYGPLKNNLGFSRISRAYTGGAPLGEEVFEFYRAIGINLKQLYAQTESSAYCCIQRDGDVRIDTVGPPGEGVELKISENGEILFRSPGTFIGYFKNQEATSETLEADGWVHTGDAGFLDDSGHLKVIDRAKDVGHLTDGTLFAPQYIENKLKFYAHIKEAVAIGASRDYVNCFVNIDLDAVGNWAERRGLSYTSYVDLANRDEVYELIRGHIQEVNSTLAKDSALASSQIRRFLILHKELDADDGELTRTRKVRRRVIAERYGPIIDGLYSDKDQVNIETQVMFEDGRTGMLKANLKIWDVEAPSMQQAAE